MPAPTGAWRVATVREVQRPYDGAVVLRLEVPDRIDHLPGQHYVVRLTAEDGYTAQRSYSVASAPDDPLVELYIERLPDGEVSGYLGEAVEPGDQLEVRGPIGGWFAWEGDTPAVGVGGGSGVVPLIAMLRHARKHGTPELLRIAVSSRTWQELPYGEELAGAGAVIALSREASAAGRAAGRLTAGELAPLVRDGATYFVCGSAAFSEAATMLLMDLGVPSTAVRVERFGPTA